MHLVSEFLKHEKFEKSFSGFCEKNENVINEISIPGPLIFRMLKEVEN